MCLLSRTYVLVKIDEPWHIPVRHKEQLGGIVVAVHHMVEPVSFDVLSLIHHVVVVVKVKVVIA
tara:strand:- start:1976 stop:2167 length:192 start_codon:yes stop_codon:yes gene_type:complete